MALFRGSKDNGVGAPEGESPTECMKVGQALVEAGHLSAEVMAATLAHANGDLLVFSETLLSKGVGRAELTLALSTATGLPAVDTKDIEVKENIKGVLDEAMVRKLCAVAVAEDGGSGPTRTAATRRPASCAPRSRTRTRARSQPWPGCFRWSGYAS